MKRVKDNLETIAGILDECFAKARGTGTVIGTTTAEEAKFLDMSAGHLSRIRNERVPLTDEVIAKIVLAFTKGDKKRSEALKGKLTRLKMVAHANAATAAREKKFSPMADIGEYSIENLVSFFDNISSTGNLLAVDYRDLPQAKPGGRYEKFALNTIEGVKRGLSLALFQPFGTAEKILEKEKLLEGKALTVPDARMFLDACHYLFDLAMGVRAFYENVTQELEKETEKGGEIKGSIVLYEAVRGSDDEMGPSLAACGIQSRLFYADYTDSIRHREVYEWVVAYPDNDRFIRRGELSINLAAMRTQFSPILNYWEKYTKLPVGEDVENAYKEFITPLLDKEAKGETRWREYRKQ